MALDPTPFDGKPAGQAVKAVRLPSLSFDSSNSAMARFYGPMAEVDVHWPTPPEDGAMPAFDQRDLFCPVSFRELLPLAERGPERCLACGVLPSVPRRISLAWDLTRRQWCTFIGHPFTFEQVIRAWRGCGATPKMMAEGLGPDCILQRIGRNTSCQAMPETMGVPISWSPPPSLVTVLLGIMQRSQWSFMTPEQAAREAARRTREGAEEREADARASQADSEPTIPVAVFRQRMRERLRGVMASWRPAEPWVLERAIEPPEPPERIPPRTHPPSPLKPRAKKEPKKEPKEEPKEEPPQDDLRVKDRWGLL